ncbi:hypothetical protein HDE_01795 [Halotydeus destructor]|nr:hypothetical protein HDE_01795 [Halotydeus destructor]
MSICKRDKRHQMLETVSSSQEDGEDGVVIRSSVKKRNINNNTDSPEMRLGCRWLRKSRFVFTGSILFLLLVTLIALDHRYWTLKEKQICSPDRHSVRSRSYTHLLPKLKKESNIFHAKPTWIRFSDDIYLYSAHSDQITGQVSLIAITRREKRFHDVYCHINGIDSVHASVEELPEHHDKQFTASRLTCDHTTIKSPVNVSVTYEGVTSEEIPILVLGATSSAAKPEPVLCLRPLYGPFNDTDKLVEALAYYHANGVKKFVLFDYAITNYTQNVLSRLGHEIIVLKWNLEDKVASSIHEYGQLAFSNICLGLFPFNPVILVDMDEFIVTRFNPKSTVASYINYKLRQNSKLVALIVPMTLFCDQFNQEKPDKSDEESKNPFKESQFKVLRNTLRQKSVWHYSVRSKQIVLRPYLVKTTGIHNIWKLHDSVQKEENVRVLDVPSSELLLYHYRDCCGLFQYYIYGLDMDFLSYRTLQDNVISDLSMHRFADGLLKYVRQDSINAT